MKRLYIVLIVVLVLASGGRARGAEMRRPVSPLRPMWLVHVTSNDREDVVETLDGLPDDLKPYVVLNLAMNHKADPSLLDYYLGQCKDKGVWVMIQPSSGVQHYMDSVNMARYEDYYRKYPNLVGYNFCEQAWGFTSETFAQRCELYCKLLEIGSKYGGYLYINDMQSVSNNPWNTISKMKKHARYAECVRRYSRNLIYGDKLTMALGYYDNESACLGMFLGGYADNYAVRYDQFSWSYSGRTSVFGEEYDYEMPNALSWLTCPEALAGISIAEHLMMTGATVIDGPEISSILIIRHGRMTPGGKNVVADVVRKVVDGTLRIPTREEVRARVKAAYVCDNSSTVDDPLYTGLYGMDGEKKQNRTYLKRTGRYLTIPSLAFMPEDGLFDVVVTQRGDQSYANRWPTEAAKVEELNLLYPEEYTGTMYVGRADNRLLAYNNSINTDVGEQAYIPLKYNSCDAVRLDFTPHTFAVIEERAEGLQVYLNNYRTDKSAMWLQYPGVSEDDGLPRLNYNTAFDYFDDTFIDNPTDRQLRQSVIAVSGCTAKPTVTWKDRGDHPASSVKEEYADGTLTLTITHNGPLDISIQCAGSNQDRLDAPTFAAVEGIPQPDMQADIVPDFLAYDFEDMAEGDALTTSTQLWLAADGAGAAQITQYGGSLALNPTAIGTGTNRVGVANLTRFGAEQDYAVTWKEYTTQVSKGGVLMRGTYADGGANPGLMDGYYFQVNTDLARGDTRVAIRKVTNKADGTTQFDNGQQGEAVLPAPEAGRPRWYRATCQNNLLTLEYSDDGLTFTQAIRRADSKYHDAGITQLLWGVGVPDVKTTYYDDIRLTYLSDTATTGIGDIHAVTAPSSQNDAWYTLQGVRIARPTAPGVYIRGGRKYVVR